jgi:hypothetical protein
MNTNLRHLENYIGQQKVRQIELAMSDWYGPPIALAGVPGHVFAHRGGHFEGKVLAGSEACIEQRVRDHLRTQRTLRVTRLARAIKQSGGFPSLSALIQALTTGQRFDFNFQKAGATGVVSSTNTLWYVGNQPAAGGNAAAAPGGTVPDDTSTGTFTFTNPASGTIHFVNAQPVASVAGNTLLMYDRLFSVTKTMSSSATEAVTGVPTRYQSNTATDPDHAGGNFLMIECRTALSATAHNWTTCTYTDQSGNTGATLPSVTGNSSNIQYRLDQPAGTWFAPLASGDYGIKALTQMQCSNAALTGAIDFTIGHPIAFWPCPLANILCPADGVNSVLSLVRVFNDACLAFIEILKPATGATNYAGSFTLAHGA